MGGGGVSHFLLAFTTQALVSSLMEQSAEEIGDLYLDVGEAYLEKGAYLAALPLLSALIISEKYNLAVVWLRHAGSLASTFREVLRGRGICQ